MIKIKNQILRGLPKVDPLLESKEGKELIKEFTRDRVKLALRDSLSFYRANILEGIINEFITVDEVFCYAKNLLNIDFSNSLKSVINATGIVIHTNLGRSILSRSAIEAVNNVAKNYSNLEYNLAKGERGSRHVHTENLLIKLTGAQSAMVVNNNAAAVMLILNEIAKGKEAIISRGELVEIGGSFRIPDVMEYSGCILKEIGATNRTHKKDYINAINENTGVLLKVHSSNYKIVGFTSEVESEEIAKLGKKYGIPTYEDLGSGMLLKINNYIDEKTVKETIDAGIDIVSFSGDKMLGGPQAGIIVGKKEYIDRFKKNPLARALRVDKFTIAALEATLLEYLKSDSTINEVPTLKMISQTEDEIYTKASTLKDKLSEIESFDFNIVEDISFVGGGAMPNQGLKTYVLESKCDVVKVEKSLRNLELPIITRIKNGKLIMDLRTIDESEFDFIVRGFKEIGKKL